MKAILISIKPKWVAKILNGEKTIEIRKTTPKCDLPIDVYIYCTKEEELFYSRDTKKWYVAKNRKNVKRLSNGVVKAKFTLNKVEKVLPFIVKETKLGGAYELTKEKIMICQKARLIYEEYNDYLKCKLGYAWHISNLVIFDKPKELSEFEHYNLTEKSYRRFPHCDFNLTKAPQSWQFVESEN